MTEPLFSDCLTDAQVWSLFNTGVLQGYRVPARVYHRLERLAPDHGCYLFAWPAGIHLPPLDDLVGARIGPAEEAPAPPPSSRSETQDQVERVRATIVAFCARVNAEQPPPGGRMYMIAMTPYPELRAGPYLEPQTRDLNAMSLPELEAYLNDVLWIDEGGDADLASLVPRPIF
jgi:hypothetical protein